MLNQVDTSAETVARDWARIEAEHKVPPVETIQLQPDSVQSESQPDTGEGKPENKPDLPSMDDLQKRMLTKAAISRTIKTGTELVGRVSLPDAVFDGVGEAYTDLVLKYFPEMGVFSLMEKYKVELAAVTATATFALAYRTAKKSQREQLRQRTAANDDDNPQEQAA